MLKNLLTTTETEHLKTILRYNQWFIKLRWYAAISIIAYTLILEIILKCNLTIIQFVSFISVTILIICYNILLSKRINQNLSKQFVFSFWQIILDLVSLLILVYFSGGVEAPIILLFIFHMIIGSIILPRKLIYSISSILIVILFSSTILELTEIIPHNRINGLFPIDLYKIHSFIFSFLTVFSFLLLMTIKITTRIVSELYSREAQLKRALDETKSAEESKQRYVMAVVHELKSPIAAAISGLDILLGGYVGDISNEVSGKINKIKIRLEESILSINNILHVSRFKLFHQLQLEELNFRAMLDSLIAPLSDLIKRKELLLNVDLKSELPVKADKVLLSLALSNLINNSIKYTKPKGMIQIQVDRDEHFVNLRIMDNGIGIPKDEQGKVFDDYYRASNVESIEGTGTGLSLVHQIIIAHKGTINLFSPSTIGTIERPGSEFIVHLPIN